ncbi:MAG: RNA polymerase subunit sigma-70 [Chloroflexi bacterium]|nr:RNA polymerase subunit sigma-70 [Chloroflexota bacterium]
MQNFRSRGRSTAAASAPQEFAILTEPYRRELQVHCYRLLGSLQDAEDLVQETLLRAWQKRAALREQSALRAWLYKIATNACLDTLRQRPKRTLPTLAAPALTAPSQPAPAIVEPIWLEPLPEDWLATPEQEPHARYSQIESISLAFLAALQYLPPRQRAVLILGDVLDWRAQEIAQRLGLTVAAVNSALHRARATMHKHYRTGEFETLRMSDAATRQILERYVRAWENADIENLVALLATDARLAMPPTPSWYRGREAIGGMLAAMAFANASPETWRLVPTRANGLPAYAMYQRAGDQAPQPFGVMLLQLAQKQITEVIVFMMPDLVRRFV